MKSLGINFPAALYYLLRPLPKIKGGPRVLPPRYEDIYIYVHSMHENEYAILVTRGLSFTSYLVRIDCGEIACQKVTGTARWRIRSVGTRNEMHSWLQNQYCECGGQVCGCTTVRRCFVAVRCNSV